MRDVQKASLLYTHLQCTPLLVKKVGVTLDVTLRSTTCKQQESRWQNHTGFKIDGEAHTTSKIRVISGPQNGLWSKEKFKKYLHPSCFLSRTLSHFPIHRTNLHPGFLQQTSHLFIYCLHKVQTVWSRDIVTQNDITQFQPRNFIPWNDVSFG